MHHRQYSHVTAGLSLTPCQRRTLSAVTQRVRVVLQAQPQLTASPELVQNEGAQDLLMAGVAGLEGWEGLTHADKIKLLASALGTICKERCGCNLAGCGVQVACQGLHHRQYSHVTAGVSLTPCHRRTLSAVTQRVRVVLQAHPLLTASPELVQNEGVRDLLMAGLAGLECLEGLTHADKLQPLASALGSICRDRCGCNLAGCGVQGGAARVCITDNTHMSLLVCR